MIIKPTEITCDKRYNMENSCWSVAVLLVCLRVGSVLMTEHLSYRMVEELPPEAYVGNVARDSSLSKNYSADILQELEFEVLTKGHLRNLFILNGDTGVLKTKVQIDRESICPLQEHCVIKLDIAVRPTSYFQVIKVRVNIEDRNDYSPSFAQNQARYSVLENTAPGVLFPLVPAEDLDSPEYSIQKYELRGDNSKYFGLQATKTPQNTFDLSLLLRSRLDREEESSYTLELVAYDGGNPPRVGAQLLQLHVRDANDNAPEFKHSPREIDIPENFPTGQTIVTMSATDPDSGLNGKISYSLESKSYRSYGQLFHVNRRNGTVSLMRELDYETQQIYSLKILASDSGEGVSLTSTAVLIIHVLDVNDNFPEILVNSVNKTETGDFVIRVKEHEPAHTFVGLISAKDDDKHENGHLECGMQEDPGHHYFIFTQILQNEYKLKTSVPFDREVLPQHSVKISCNDHGTPTHKSIISITVIVLDINDNPPEFTQGDYFFTIQENNEVGAIIGQLHASDKDSEMNGKVTYQFCNQNSHIVELVSLDERFGTVIANVGFDREAEEELIFCARALDHGTNEMSSETEVIIKISDQDDESPHFSQSKYEFSVAENELAGKFVGRVLAFDRDSPPNNEFSFRLTNVDNAQRIFRIVLTTGEIFTRTRLDRELKDLYILNVSVMSNAYQLKSDFTQAYIKVKDANDNIPVIKYPPPKASTVIQVSGKVPPGHIVTKINATDRDLGENSRLTYGFMTKVAHFSIDSTSGIITVADDISSIETQSFNVPVMVSDNGKTPLNATVGFKVTVNQSIPYVSASRRIKESSGFWGENWRIILIAAVVATVGVLFLIIVAVLCLAYNKSSSKRGKCQGTKYSLAKADDTKKSRDGNEEPANSDEEEGKHIASAVISLQISSVFSLQFLFVSIWFIKYIPA